MPHRRSILARQSRAFLFPSSCSRFPFIPLHAICFLRLS
jgi:hypothetical protein